jgi:hypothetical protein
MKKITINGVELDLTQEQVESLKKTLDEKDDVGWRPKEKNLYWSIDGGGRVVRLYNFELNLDHWSFVSGNCFKTEHEAEMHKLRLQSMAERKWVTDTYWYFDFKDATKKTDYNDEDNVDMQRYLAGNMFLTSEEVGKYAEAWKILLPNNENK